MMHSYELEELVPQLFLVLKKEIIAGCRASGFLSEADAKLYKCAHSWMELVNVQSSDMQLS
jgi:hypothetical protein